MDDASAHTPPTSTPAPTAPVQPPPAAPPPAPGPPRLVRPRDDRVVAGVASGIGRHIGVDPAPIRVAFVVLTLAGGSGVLVYLIAWLVIPEEPIEATGSPTQASPNATGLRLVAGVFFVLLGLSWLLDRLVPDFGRIAWPIALIAAGAAIVIAGARR